MGSSFKTASTIYKEKVPELNWREYIDWEEQPARTVEELEDYVHDPGTYLGRWNDVIELECKIPEGDYDDKKSW
jgi:hypothetical protein